MSATAPATVCSAPSQPLDHPELLMLDGAVSRLVDRYLESRTLTTSQREILGEYCEDADELSNSLLGPARDYAEQMLALVRTVLDSTATAINDAPLDASYAA